MTTVVQAADHHCGIRLSFSFTYLRRLNNPQPLFSAEVFASRNTVCLGNPWNVFLFFFFRKTTVDKYDEVHTTGVKAWLLLVLAQLFIFWTSVSYSLTPPPPPPPSSSGIPGKPLSC